MFPKKIVPGSITTFGNWKSGATRKRLSNCCDSRSTALEHFSIADCPSSDKYPRRYSPKSIYICAAAWPFFAKSNGAVTMCGRPGRHWPNGKKLRWFRRLYGENSSVGDEPQMNIIGTPLPLDSSYAYCERLARTEARHFYPAFRFLPARKRRAMCALYAFLRITDDLSDDLGSISDKQLHLASWRDQFARSLAGEHQHALYPALHHA